MSNTVMICDKSDALNNKMINNKPITLRMSERDKQQTYQAAMLALDILNQRRKDLNKYRIEVLNYAANNPGNYSFTFNMDFMKVAYKLLLGYAANNYAQSQTRQSQISAESLKISKETGVSYLEVREVFFLLMRKYIKL